MSAATKASESRKKKAPEHQNRSTARLAAVQALYEIELTDTPGETVLREFLYNRWDVACQSLCEETDEKRTGPDTIVPPDGEMFNSLVRGVLDSSAELDTIIGEALAAEWHMERMEVVLKCILRAGCYELLARPDIPPHVVTCEYLDIAKAFYTGHEPGLVNAVLDTLAHRLRANEMTKESAKGGKATKGKRV